MNANILDLLPGKKTYITAIIGVIVVWLQVYLGDLSPLDVAITGGEAATLTWGALLSIFVRKGSGK